MEKKYRYEEILSGSMSLPSNEHNIAALQVGFASLVAALEKSNPGVADSFFAYFDANYVMNRESTAAPAIAQLGAMVKAGLMTKI
ncbi:hypothetical protein ACJ5W6_002580 [Enterobacter hormaechei]|uniref:hypothetical protein n=1 Tax=Enterobacter hormaechei TaxID=158836 RepID=UPI0005F8D625|nr:hypothetical protein [Enterobacter hormaechei]EKV8158078.1 hypothetical protein [Enterobacter hormaechei subsp. xiangfangensis]EKV9560972.1 hypothetical protein [Enterobacter hormaechei]EKW7489884.1 hypothetical protein [Enterobacter hormaechei]KJX12715.1 hypothetical protein SG64_23865 [Enterobacter hormaechei subsp. xiangfangensis]RTN58057.1 hypothetical protein EKN91_01720 [Enterobacter hormaechei]